MKKLLLTLLILLIFAGQALAATYYVKPRSIIDDATAATATGADCDNAKNIKWFNYNAANDDTCILCDGTYDNVSDLVYPGAANDRTGQTYEAATQYGAKLTASYGVWLDAGDTNTTVDGIWFYGIAGEFAVYIESDDNEIKNCKFEATSSSDHPLLRVYEADNNYIHNNIFTSSYQATSEIDELDMLSLWGADKTRITYNTFEEGLGHAFIYLLGWSNYTVVRYNTFTVSDAMDVAGYYAGVDLVFQSEILSDYNLIENNTITETDNPTYVKAFPVGFLSSRYGIFRYNEINGVNGGCALWAGQPYHPVDYNSIYHNTFYDVNSYHSSYGVFNLRASSTAYYVRHNSFINNIISGSTYRVFRSGQGLTSGECASNITDNIFDNNLVYNITPDNDVTRCGSSVATVLNAETSWPSEFSDNINEQDPKFVTAGSDFTLQSDSPAIDAAGALTLTNGTGSASTALIVDDAKYFYDGWGITGETADTIYVNATVPFSVQISSINYITNTITLASAQTWQDGCEVYHLPDGVMFSGSAPDIGAHEYTGTTTTPTCTEGQITSTCLCGGVEYSSGHCCSDVWQNTSCLLSQELIAHYKFDETSGTTAYDSSGNGNTGTITGAIWTTGKINNALSFDGIDDYVSVPDSVSLNPGYLTTSLWFRPDSFTDNTGLIAKGDNSNRQYWEWIYQGNISLEIDEGNHYNYLYSLQTNTWYHLAVTYDGSEIVVYVDGNEVNRIPQSTGTILIDDDSLFIGTLPGFVSFDGLIDEVKIFNQALSSSEILGLYNEAGSICGNADSNTDGSVSITELINYITQWKAGEITITELIAGIGEWKNGCG